MRSARTEGQPLWPEPAEVHTVSGCQRSFASDCGYRCGKVCEMSEQRSRRDFLKLTAAGIAGMGLVEAMPAATRTVIDADRPVGDISVRLTAGAKRFAEQPPIRWRDSSGPTAAAIKLDLSKTYQDILGFGAAFTDAACYNINQLDA